jgi:aspartate carbamoyltransferase
MSDVQFSNFAPQIDRPTAVKVQDFQRQGRLKHIIFGQQLTPQLLEKLCRSADTIRTMAKDPNGNAQLRNLLADKRAMLYFTQPSTRTFLSFMAACQILGITCNEVRDPKTSSEVKRESRTDSIRMFSSYFDVIIMRSQIEKFAEVCAYMMNDLEEQEQRSVPIINAGAGSDEHPTQALLDMYTIYRSFDFDNLSANVSSRLYQLKRNYPDLVSGPQQKTYLFCGDISRGRTVKSLAVVLSQYPGVRMFFVSPDHPTLRLDAQLQNFLVNSGVDVHQFDSLDATINGTPILAETDCFYMTRIQREHNTPDVEAELSALDLSPFQLSVERVQRLKSFAAILHPFPRDEVVGEIPPEVDRDPRAMYFRQARNGMWARAALLVHLFDASEDLYFAQSKAMGRMV